METINILGATLIIAFFAFIFANIISELQKLKNS